MGPRLDLEKQLRAYAGQYDGEFTTTTRMEQGIVARIATTPREAHQAPTLRRELAFGALFLLFVALVVVGIGRIRALQQQVPAHPSPTVSAPASVICVGPGGTSAVPIRMLSPTTGWAVGPLRTTDGGAHWSKVCPPSTPNRSAGSQDFILDGTRAWEAQSGGSSTSHADHVITFRTTDGGRTWQPGSPVPVQVTPGGMDLIYPQLDFVDPEHGWLFVEWGPGLIAPSPSARALFRTADGGFHWNPMPMDTRSLPAGCTLDRMVFASGTSGLLTFYCQDARPDTPSVLVTSDGGISWQLIRLLQPAFVGHCPCTNNQPLFLHQRNGVLQVSGNDRSSVLLVTSDGGVTWTPRALPGSGRDTVVDFVDADHGWALVGGASPTSQNAANAAPPAGLYRTDDGGRTWVLLRTNLLKGPQNSSISGLFFVDAKNGFASRVNQDATVGDNGANGFDLLRTTDGGRTWVLVDVRID